MATSPEFEKRYRALNQEQKRAVDAVDGPVMVIAGPGTGKTQILTLRIANILLKTDTKPENVLALTYTESGAHNMKKRLAEIVGSAAYKVTISTFHGFANELIARYPEKFPNIIGGVPVTEVEAITMIKSILDDGIAKALRLPGDSYYYVDPALRSLHTLKREGFTPEAFDQLLNDEERAIASAPDRVHEKGAYKGRVKKDYIDAERSLLRSRALAELYHEYQARLRAMKRFDYEDMILETVRAMETDNDFLLVLQEEYQYLLADEHQDTNNAQNRIIELLASFHASPNLFIVGDEKQAIYRFQGASLSNFLYFQEKYPDVLYIKLSENYRSTQRILDSAQALITSDASDAEMRLRIPLVAKNSGDGGGEAPIMVAHLGTPRAELEFIVQSIAAHRRAGDALEEIAVLARKNSDIRELGLVLAKAGIPYHMLSEQDILEDEDVKKLIRLLRAIVYFGDDEFLVDALGSDFFRLDHLDIWRMIRASSSQKCSVHELMQHVERLAEIGVSRPEVFVTIYDRFHLWHVGMKNLHILPLVEDVIRDSGLLAELLSKPEGSARLRAIDRLYDELQSLAAREPDYSLVTFLSHLETLREYKKGLETKAAEERPGVRLMSAHKAKGLEFDHVFIMNTNERAWEGRGKRTHFRTHLVNSPIEDTQDKNDERRLFYVALTRARRSVILTLSETDQSGKAAIPSRFITDIDPALLLHTSPLVVLNEGGRYGERVLLEPRALDREFIRSRFLEQGLNATALNNFLDCHWKYVHQNLLRVPGAPNKYMIVGTAIHAALRVFFDAWRVGETMTVEKVIERFMWSLERQPLSRADRLAMEEKGHKALQGYFAYYKNSWPRTIKNEYRIEGVFLDLDIDGAIVQIPLKGSLDKVEIDGDRVNVIDYKTGKPKSRNALLGQTKDENKDYLRQLTFYKLLLSKFDKEKYVMETGTIEFVEPNESGKYVRETFLITDEEVHEVEAQAAVAARAIYDLSFWGARCCKESCEFCDLYVPLAEKSIQ
jgi:DNA helicase-2/ATP-dependent DNA helicase PcrA